MRLADALAPMLRLDPAAWAGLPEAAVADFDELFGPPAACEETTLGSYPASRRRYEAGGASDGLILYSRGDRAVMVETPLPPPLSALAALPEPDAVLARELRLPDAYPHEYLYCATGLVLTVAVPLGSIEDEEDEATPSGILRCRGIRPLARVEEFGPDYYLPLDNRVRWGAARGAAELQYGAVGEAYLTGETREAGLGARRAATRLEVPS